MVPSVRYVSRFRGDGADGWRYQRSTKEGGAEPVVYFLIKEYGDLKSALEAAQAHAIAHNKGVMKRHARAWDPRNRFDFCGLTIERRNRSRGGPIYYWTATWSEEDWKQVRRRFSIVDYGYDLAFLNAAYERIRAVGVQPNLNPRKPPEPPEEVLAWMQSHGIPR